MNIFQSKQKYSESEEHVRRQENIDAILVLSKLLEVHMTTSADNVNSANRKISQLIDKL